MKNFTKIALATIFAGISTTEYGLDLKVVTANCKQKLTQAQSIKCGINAPVNINVTGGGNVVFAPVQCAISANMTAIQQAQCTAIAGKAGDILTFSASELPQAVGVNKFVLGSITAKKDITGINAPQNDGGVLFSFVTAAGLPINFLLKRKAFTSAELDALSTETPADVQYKEKLKAKLAAAGGNGIVTFYYRQIPGMETKWTELWTDLDPATKYPLAPKFNASVYPNGLIVLHKNLNPAAGPNDIKESKQLFFVGDLELKLSDDASTTPTQIPIGNGKFATLQGV